MKKKEKSSILEFAGFLSKREGEKLKKIIDSDRKKSRKLDSERKKKLEKQWRN